MLTKTEHTVYKLNAVGKSYKEIADFLTITIETVKTHMKNLKGKKELQKSSELAALYWCEIFGTSFEDRRKQIIASCLTIVLVISFQVDFTSNKLRRPERRRNSRIEHCSTVRLTESASAA